MMNHDYDHNGRVDSRDYYIYSQTSGENGEKHFSRSSGSNMEASDIWLIIALIYFFTWIKGTLGFGFIASTLGIISGAYLFLRIMMWAYN